MGSPWLYTLRQDLDARERIAEEGGAEGVSTARRSRSYKSLSGKVRLMGVVVPVGFAQVNLQFFLTGDAEPIVVTFGVDSGSEDDPSVLADAVWSRLNDAGTIFQGSSFSSAYRMGPFVASIQTATGPQIGTGTFFVQGAVAAVAPIPQNCAVLVQKRTARGGRKGRGRGYFPPLYPTEASITAVGGIDSVPLAAWQTAMTEFHAASVAEGQPLVLLHSEEAGPIAPDPITSLTVAPIIATQRTRLRP